MLLRLAFVSLVFGLAACAEPPRTAEPIELAAIAVPLYPEEPERADLGVLEYRGGLHLTAPHAGFGGWSAMELTEDGARLLAISDQGWWLTASLTYGEDGTLTGVGDAAITPMLDAAGAPLQWPYSDAEGLAPLGGGRYAVSFEHAHRIEVYDIGADWRGVSTARPAPHPEPPGLERLPPNGGLEALERAADGGLWAGVEYGVMEGRPNTLWHIHNNALSTPYSLQLEDGFGFVALTRRDGGRLVWLERFYARDTGNRIRIMQVSESWLLSGGAEGRAPRLIGALEPGMTIDNFEAVSTAWVNGEERLFILSDDNYNPPGQRTLLLSFAFADAD
ncbi:MAG: esterase-like activity of phytase family protein [Maricaulaceae bacterium]|nr:esterase-like activity of phytase family protein [Maricaulaceae bacterium]